MPSMTSKCVKGATLFAAVAVLIGLVLLFRGGPEATPDPQRDVVPPQPEEVQLVVEDQPLEGLSDEELEAAITKFDILENPEKLSDEELEAAVRRADMLPRDTAVNDPELWTAVMELKGLLVKRRWTALLNQRDPFMDRSTAYRLEAPELKSALRSERGEISKDDIGGIVAEATLLEEEFWSAGDFDAAESFDYIVKARALLEMCNDVDPDNEAALRQLCETLQAGWPMTVGDETTDPDGQRTLAHIFQRKYELYIPMYRLWKTHIANKPEATLADLSFAYDIVYGSRLDESRKKDIIARLREINPDPSERMSAFLEEGIPQDEKLAVAQWALKACQEGGEELRASAAAFQEYIEAARSGRTPKPTAATFFYDPSEVDAAKYGFGRGASFQGPQERADQLIPAHTPRKLE